MLVSGEQLNISMSGYWSGYVIKLSTAGYIDWYNDFSGVQLSNSYIYAATANSNSVYAFFVKTTYIT
jgi:hypothetical protein